MKGAPAIINPATVKAWLMMPLYGAFTQYTAVLPKMYWDVYSAEERVKLICAEIGKLCAYANELGIKLNVNTEEVKALYEEFEEFKASGFDDYYREIIEKWVDNHMEEIIDQAIKMVFFGLTEDGYFCAYIPDSWDDIEFDTGMVYGSYDYGRLILKY